MKIVVLMVVLHAIYFAHGEMVSNESEMQHYSQRNSSTLTSYVPLELARSKVKELWTRFWHGQQRDDTFIGRCFGVARKLKLVIPLIMIKLAVILTVLAFLTLFSLKALGLLIALLFINLTGIVSKVAVFFASKKDHNPWPATPQNIHFHIHPNKDGEYSVDHSSAGWNKWDRDSMSHTSSGWDKWDRDSISDVDNVGIYNLYRKLERMPYSKVEYAR